MLEKIIHTFIVFAILTVACQAFEKALQKDMSAYGAEKDNQTLMEWQETYCGK